MTTPPSGPSDARDFPEVTQPAAVLKAGSSRSPVDSPYTSARSPSGHLIPYSPVPTRRHSVPWIAAGQSSIHEEPSSLHHDEPHVVAESLLQTSPSTTIHTHRDNDTSNSNILEASFATNPSLQSIHASFNASDLESHRGTSYSSRSIKTSSHSQGSYGSQKSRQSYRTHRGVRARVRTPISEQNAIFLEAVSADPLSRAEPTGSAAPEIIIAPPRLDDPTRPGTPLADGPRFLPISAKGVLRYSGHRTSRLPFGQDHRVEAMAHQYPSTPAGVPMGWEACCHPEGALYFVHRQSNTLTEVNICDEVIYNDIEYFRGFLLLELEAEIKERGLLELKTAEVQLVLEPGQDDLGVMCCYYFVNPSARCLFWLNEWDAEEIFKESKGILSLPHKGLAIQAHYWWATMRHWDLYPSFCKVTQELKDEVTDMILHATCDQLTSNTSAFPLNHKELKEYLALVERINPDKIGKHERSAIIIGRIMYIFYRAYFFNYYGEDCARLNSDQSVYGWRYSPSLLMKIFAPLSFMASVTNVQSLHKIFVDDITSTDRWNAFVAKLNSQLQESSVLATVLLNANVAFLPKQSGTGTLPQQYLSYMSLVASVASIILGLVFMGRNRTEERNTAFEAAKFLNSLQHKKHGLEALAIIYSLPHAFLMWGMFLFFAAFAVQWCYPLDAVSRACVGTFMLVAALVVAWCIWAARDRSESWWFQPDMGQAGLGEVERWQGDGMSFVSFLLGFPRWFKLKN